MNSATLPESLIAQLRSYESRLKRMETIAAIAGGFAGLFITYVLLFVADRFVNTPIAARLVLTATGAVLAAMFAQSWARYWLWTRRGPGQLAKLLQGHFRGLGDRLQGVIELTETEQLPENISPALLRAAVRQVAEESGRCNFEDAVPTRPARRWGLAAAVVTALAAAPFLMAPKAATNAAQRWAMPWAEIERFTFTTVEQLPSDLYVAHGEKFELAVGLRADAQWKPGSATAQIGEQEKLTAAVAESRAVFAFPGQTRDGVIALRVGDYLKDIALHPLHRPELKELSARVKLPEYLGYPEQRVALHGSSGEFLEGSSVAFEGGIARGMGRGEIASADFTWPAVAEGNVFRTPSISLTGLGSEVRFTWADIHGLAPVQPYTMRVSAGKDAEPRIEVQNLETEVAILPHEEVQFVVAASDDFGLKETWLSWELRKVGQKPEAETAKEKQKEKPLSVSSLWEDWKKDNKTAEKPKHETPRVAGGQKLKESVRPMRWAPADWNVPEDSVVELVANALDFFPERKPSQSWKFTIFVLSPEKHAERIRERMDNVLKQLDERIRDEERQMEEAKEIAQRKDADSEKAGDDIKRAEAGEKQNAEELKKLVAQMQDVMKDALRNKEIQSDTIKDYSDIAKKLDEEANPAQQKASEALAKAGQSPQSRQEAMKEAQDQQQKALDAMREAANKMQTANQNLFARNFYNRLRHAASQEFKISDGLKKLAKMTVGLKPDEIGEGEKKEFNSVAGSQDGAVKDVDSIQNDMTAFLRRVPNEKYETVVKEMEDTKVVSELGELAGFVRANLGLKSVGKAKTWGDQINKWADAIQSECNCKGGEGEGEQDPDEMELMIAMVRAAVAQDTIRDQTGELEKTKAADNYPTEATKVSGVQSGLAGSVKKLTEEPKFAKFMQKFGPLLDKVGELMTESAGELKTPKTDETVAQLHGTIIELLVPPDKKGGKPNPQSQQMQKMMQQMMQQMAKGKKPGKNASQNASSLAGTPADGASGRTKANARVVDKSGGASSAGEWPEEFRDALQSFIQAVEEK